MSSSRNEFGFHFELNYFYILVISETTVTLHINKSQILLVVLIMNTALLCKKSSAAWESTYQIYSVIDQCTFSFSDITEVWLFNSNFRDLNGKWKPSGMQVTFNSIVFYCSHGESVPTWVNNATLSCQNRLNFHPLQLYLKKKFCQDAFKALVGKFCEFDCKLLRFR